MRRRFFVDQFEAGRAALRGEAAHHLGRVLRAEPGQLYELSDGQAVWLGRIERVAKNAVDFVLVEELPATASTQRIRLLLSIVKFDRFEWSLEKATELGVDEVIPLAAVRSEKALVVAAAKRAARWQRILLESAQQSRRLRPPVLHPALPTPDAFAMPVALAATPGAHCWVLLSEQADAPSLKKVLSGKGSDVAGCVLAIGPEGGWTEEERAAARSRGFQEASLGANILRTETAVIAALAIVNFALAE
jgi:16S rRNA (uracil1498-N3)-methyltransferase